MNARLKYPLLFVLSAVAVALFALLSPASAQNPTPCPAVIEPRVTAGAIQRFQHGYMVWVKDTKQIYVLIDPSAASDGLTGTVEVYSDTWVEGETNTDPSLVPPFGQLQPDRGFGKVWRETNGLRDRLGFAWQPVDAFTMLIYDGNGKMWFNTHAAYVFTVSAGTWQRVDVWAAQK